jgi:hypothetical protein
MFLCRTDWGDSIAFFSFYVHVNTPSGTVALDLILTRSYFIQHICEFSLALQKICIVSPKIRSVLRFNAAEPPAERDEPDRGVQVQV